MTKENVIGAMIMAALFAPVPFGIFMTFYTNDTVWLWWCGFIIFFLS